MPDEILFSPFGPDGRYFAVKRDWRDYDRVLADLRLRPLSAADAGAAFLDLQDALFEGVLCASGGHWRAPFGRHLFVLDGAQRSVGLTAAAMRADGKDLAPRILVLDLRGSERPAKLVAFEGNASAAVERAQRHAEIDVEGGIASVQFTMGTGALRLDAPLESAWKKLLDGVADLDGGGLSRKAISRHLAQFAKEIDRAEAEVRSARRGTERLATAIALDVGTLPADETGPGRIFELGMVELRDGRRDGGSADQIRFNVPVSDLKRLKKADRDLLASEKTFARFAPALRRKIGAAPILGWNVDGDLKSLNREFDLARVEPIPREQAIDLLSLARRIVPGLSKGGYELGNFAERLSIAPSFKLHLSLQDADLVAHLAEHAAFRPHVAARIRAIAPVQFSLAAESAPAPSLSEAIRREMEELERVQQGALFDARAEAAARATRNVAWGLAQDGQASPAIESVARDGFARLIEDVHAIARRMNPTVSVEVAARLVGTDAKSLLASGALPDQVVALSGNVSALKKKFGLSADEAAAMVARYRDGISVAGLYRRLENVAQISFDLAEGRDPIDAAHHELWHSIEQLLTPQERRILLMDTPPSARLDDARRSALASGDKKKIEAVENETLAYSFGEWAAGRFRASAEAEAIWTRVREFLVSLGHYLRGEGFDSGIGIFRRAYEGQIGRRAVARMRQGLHPTANDVPLGTGATGMAAARGEFRIRALAQADSGPSLDDGDAQFSLSVRLDLPLRLTKSSDREQIGAALRDLPADHMKELHHLTLEGLTRVARASAKYPNVRGGALLCEEIRAGLGLIRSVAEQRGLSLDRASEVARHRERGRD